VYVLVAYVIAVKGWLASAVAQVQRAVEPPMYGVIAAIAPVASFLAPSPARPAAHGLSSKEELARLIEADKNILPPGQKQRLQAALAAADLKVGDIMVPRSHIHSVEIKETVGPLLLDRLHKQGHNIFPVIKKDLDHIEGLLYMHDLVPLDPDLKEVADAVRPVVHYMPAAAPIEAVLAASLHTGRQLFIIVDERANTVGLITLRDVVAKLLGEAPPAEQNYSSTDPKKVNT
jgi:CBS domain containing-hemolysin-like protein